MPRLCLHSDKPVLRKCALDLFTAVVNDVRGKSTDTLGVDLVLFAPASPLAAATALNDVGLGSDPTRVDVQRARTVRQHVRGYGLFRQRLAGETDRLEGRL